MVICWYAFGTYTIILLHVTHVADKEIIQRTQFNGKACSATLPQCQPTHPSYGVMRMDGETLVMVLV